MTTGTANKLNARFAGNIALGLILAAFTAIASAKSDISYTLTRIDGETAKPAAVARDFIVVLEDTM